MKIIEILNAHGHPNIKATHRTTFEVTREEYLTKKGDCIIAIGANKGAFHLSEKMKKAIRMGAKVTVIIEIDGLIDEISGEGHPSLTLEDPISLVARKSEYICPRTFMIKADKAASDIDRRIIEKLKAEYWKEVLIKIIAEIR